MEKKKKTNGNIVYSTDPDFQTDVNRETGYNTLPPDRQQLSIRIDRKNRRGKTVTLVQGFVGNLSDLSQLGKYLKKICGTGGSVKNGEIIIQGNFVKKIARELNRAGYKQIKV